MARPAVAMGGTTIGAVVVLGRAGHVKRSALWLCRCEACGSEFTRTRQRLLRSRTGSCGCVGRAMAKNLTHGRTLAPEYDAWTAMIQRCTNPKNARYAAYGGRGITVCAAWLASFEAFLADVGQRPPGTTARGVAIYSLDRIDNARGYEPGNCRWATSKQQAQNRRPRC